MDKFPVDFCYSAVAATMLEAAAEVSVEDAKKLRLAVYSKLMDGVSKGKKYFIVPCVHGVYSDAAVDTVLSELALKFVGRVYLRFAESGVFVKVGGAVSYAEQKLSALGIVMTDEIQPDVLPLVLFLSA